MHIGSSDNIHMYLYHRNGSSGLVAELTPDSKIGAAGNYMFSPTESLILDAGIYNLIIQPDFEVGTWMSWSYAPGADGAEYSEAVGETWGGWESGTSAPTYRVHYTVVPEPSTIALFLLGVSCLFARRKRKSRGL